MLYFVMFEVSVLRGYDVTNDAQLYGVPRIDNIFSNLFDSIIIYINMSKLKL